KLEEGQIAADMAAAANRDGAAQTRLSQTPVYNALMRTTCVATRLEGGHADNALPQSARATVNCRVLPGESADEVRNTLATVLSDPDITILDRQAEAQRSNSAHSPSDAADRERDERVLAWHPGHAADGHRRQRRSLSAQRG